MTELSIGPSDGLLTPADPNSGRETKFSLFSESWVDLQGFVGSAMELPISNGNFEDKYGSIGSSTTITDSIAAMKDVQAASAEFGDPKTLRKDLIENPNLLASAEPPSEIYTHTVWMGQRMHETAGKLASGYDSVFEGLSGLPPKDQVSNIKAYLFDQTLGPIPLAQKMSEDINILIKKIGRFEQKMNEYNEKLKSFTKNSSDLIAEVNVSIGGLSQKISDLKKSRDEAYAAWRDFTIAACVSSVACLLIGGLLAPLTGGVSLLVGGAAAIASGVGLGIKAAQNSAKYNEYCKLIKTEEAELKKKSRLRNDLSDFDTQMQLVGPAMSSFLRNLQSVEGVWVQMNTDMLAIYNGVDESNIGSLPFLVKAKAKHAIDQWKAVDDGAKQFTVDSLVDYSSLAFGEGMPDAA